MMPSGLAIMPDGMTGRGILPGTLAVMAGMILGIIAAGPGTILGIMAMDGIIPGTMAGTALGATVGTVPSISVIGIAHTTVGGAITGITTGDGDPTIMTGAGPTLTMTGLLIVLTDPILT